MSFHDCLEISIELGEDGSCKESSYEFVEALLLCMSTSEENISCQVNKRACLSTIVDDKSTVVVGKV